MTIYDALIIGAGPAGATVALALAKAGWCVAIIEKKKFPRRKVCGEFISATSLPLLFKLGISDLYLSKGGPEVRRVGLFAGDSILTSQMPSMSASTYQWGRALGREHLDSALLAAAVEAGATLWQPAHIEKLQREQSLFTANIITAESVQPISAKVVIRAHGSWERENLQQSKGDHQPSDLLAFKAHFTESALASDLMPLLAFPGGYGGLAHTDSGRVTLSCCIRRDKLEAIRQHNLGVPAGEVVFQHIMNNCAGVRLALSQAKREGSWLAAGPIRPGIRQRYADGLFYVGNIAGEAHPVVAEGISMAMQSAWLLSEILIKHQKEILDNNDREEAGAEYAKQWSQHFAMRIRAAAVFSWLAMNPRATAMVLPFVKLFPGLLTFGAKLSGKIQKVRLTREML